VKRRLASIDVFNLVANTFTCSSSEIFRARKSLRQAGKASRLFVNEHQDFPRYGISRLRTVEVIILIVSLFERTRTPSVIQEQFSPVIAILWQASIQAYSCYQLVLRCDRQMAWFPGAACV